MGSSVEGYWIISNIFLFILVINQSYYYLPVFVIFNVLMGYIYWFNDDLWDTPDDLWESEGS